jgi:hypothetical protein
MYLVHVQMIKCKRKNKQGLRSRGVLLEFNVKNRALENIVHYKHNIIFSYIR